MRDVANVHTGCAAQVGVPITQTKPSAVSLNDPVVTITMHHYSIGAAHVCIMLLGVDHVIVRVCACHTLRDFFGLDAADFFVEARFFASRFFALVVL